MNKSSIHIVPAKSGSEMHNKREKKLNYVRSDLSYLNSSFVVKSISDAKQFAEDNCKLKTGRTMQAKATPIREGVLLIGEHHTEEDLKKLAYRIEERFGIKTIQGYCHKDEGHYDKITKIWKPNYHAHLIFDWTDHGTGKSIKLNCDDMADFQTLVADCLQLERGISSSKRHLNVIQYKNQQEQKDLEVIHRLKNGLSDAQSVLQLAESIKKELEPLKMAKNSLNADLQNLSAEKERLKLIAEQERQRAIKEHQLAESIKKELEPLKMAKNSLNADLQSLSKSNEQLKIIGEQERQRAIKEHQQAETIKKELERLKLETKLHEENLRYVEEKGKEQENEIRRNELIIKEQEMKINKPKGFGMGR